VGGSLSISLLPEVNLTTKWGIGVFTMEKEPSAKISQFLTVKEMAERLRLSPATIYNKRHVLGGFKIGGSIRFDWDKTIERLREESEQEASLVSTSHRLLMKPPRDRRRRKTVYELIPDRHGLLEPDHKIFKLNPEKKFMGERR
jgi:hypothetical protein